MMYYLADFLNLRKTRYKRIQRGRNYVLRPRENYNDFLKDILRIAQEEGLLKLRVRGPGIDLELNRAHRHMAIMIREEVDDPLDLVPYLGKRKNRILVYKNRVIIQLATGDVDYLGPGGQEVELKGITRLGKYQPKGTERVLFTSTPGLVRHKRAKGILVIPGQKPKEVEVEVLEASIPSYRDARFDFPVRFRKKVTEKFLRSI